MLSCLRNLSLSNPLVTQQGAWQCEPYRLTLSEKQKVAFSINILGHLSLESSYESSSDYFY